MPKNPTQVLMLSPIKSKHWAEIMRQHMPNRHFDEIPLDVCDAGPVGKVMAPWRVWRRILQADVVVSSDAHIALGTAVLLYLFARRKPHVALTFNLVNRSRFHPALDWLARIVLRSVTLFVTPSDHEREVFAQTYHLDMRRFAFEHWGGLPPEVAALSLPPQSIAADRPYFCAIGRNNRDFELFAKAFEGAPYRGVIITMKRYFDGVAIPDNVDVYYDLDQIECLRVIRHSLANVIPLKSDRIGAGHITMVFAMHLGKPQIVTALPAIADYFIADQHGLGVKPGDVAGLRSAMDEIYQQPERAAQMGEAARQYAQRWLTGKGHFPLMIDILDAIEQGKPLPDAQRGWREWQQSNRA